MHADIIVGTAKKLVHGWARMHADIIAGTAEAGPRMGAEARG